MGDMKYNWALKELALAFSGTFGVLLCFLHGWQCWKAKPVSLTASLLFRLFNTGGLYLRFQQH